MMNLILLLGLICFGLLMHRVSPVDTSSSAAYAMGLMMLIGYLSGRLARRHGFPSITGYLLAGMLIGPFGLNVISSIHVTDLHLINGLALSLIALTAGGEIRLARLRPHFRVVSWVLSMQTLIMIVGMTMGFWILTTWVLPLPFASTAGLLSAGLLIGIVSTASSPSTTLAVIVESGKRTVTTDLILGVVMLKDIVILFLFCVGLNVAHALNPAESSTTTSIGGTFLQISGSVLAGMMIGGLIILFLSRVRNHPVVFILAVCFFSYEVFEPLGLHPLLIMMTAGFLVVNLSREGNRLMDHLEAISPPVYVLFFTLAGAALRLDLLTSVGLLAMALVVLRLFFKWAGTRAGIHISGKASHLRHRGWAAFVSQAGLSLGLATIIAEQFPRWGKSVAVLILAAIFINQLIGPLTLKWLLDKENRPAQDE